MESLVSVLPHVNASLNALATLLLLIGLMQIKRRQERSHKWTMLACFGVSVLFLACYLTYHYSLHAVAGTAGRKFPTYPPLPVRYTYYVILLTHVVLAAAVPFLAIGSIYYGLRDNRPKHRWLSKITFPVWLYVSVTGVIVYLMLYQIYPPQELIVP